MVIMTSAHNIRPKDVHQEARGTARGKTRASGDSSKRGSPSSPAYLTVSLQENDMNFQSCLPHLNHCLCVYFEITAALKKKLTYNLAL